MIHVRPGSTDITVEFRVVQTSAGASPGEPKTGLTFSDVSTASYHRTRGAATAITPITLASPTAAHADGGFVEIDATNEPGVYRFDIPDAVVAVGAQHAVVVLVFSGASNAIAEPLRIDIDASPDQFWDQARSEHVAAGSFGEGVLVEDLNAAAKASVNAEVDTALSDINLDHLVPFTGAISDASPTISTFDTDLSSAVDDFHKGSTIIFVGGALSGVSRNISDYVGSTKTISVQQPLPATPADTDPFVIVSAGYNEVSLTVQGINDANSAVDTALSDVGLDDLVHTSPTADVLDGAPTASSFGTNISQATDDFFNDMVLVMTSGALKGQARRISDWVGSTSKIFVSPAFTSAPADNDKLAIFSPTYQRVITDELGTQAKLDVNAEVDAALDTAIPSSPTADSINERIKALDDGMIGEQAQAVTGTLLPKEFTTDLASSTNDFYNGMVVTFFSGALAGLSRHVRDYDGSTKKITVSPALPSAPANTDDFAVVLPSPDNLFQNHDELAGEPGARPIVREGIMWGYMVGRNKLISDSNTNKAEVHDDAGTKIADSTVTDAGGIFTREKYA